MVNAQKSLQEKVALTIKKDTADKGPVLAKRRRGAADVSFIEDALLLPEGLLYAPVPGDGHCLYHAVGLYVGESQEDLRAEVAFFIEKMIGKVDEREAVEFLGIINALLPQGSSMVDYVRDIRSGLQWADNPEIFILSRIYNRPILVLGPNGGILNRDALEVEGEPIFVYYNGHSHYDGLINTKNRSVFQILADLQRLTEININLEARGTIALLKKTGSDAPSSAKLVVFSRPKRSLSSTRTQAECKEDLMISQGRKRIKFGH